jgi:regulator of protease activity HflC (stomatin/prohibitin superfamily)
LAGCPGAEAASPRSRQWRFPCAGDKRAASRKREPPDSRAALRDEGEIAMPTLAGFSVFAIILVLFVLITVMMGIRQVPQGYNYTVERFGRYNKTLTPGLGVIIPYFDRVGRKLNVMEQVIDVPSQEIITKDNATVKVDGVAFYQVLDVRSASYEVSNLEQALLNLVMTNIRTVMGSMDLDQLLSHRDEINVRLLTVIDAAALPWGIKVTRIEIKDIEPPKDLIDAMGRQMKAEREKRAVILEAEGMRQADITRAEGKKQAVVLEAEGRKEAAFRDAEARERSAQAEAAATGMVSKALAEGDLAALNYFIAEKYVKSIQALAEAPNQKVFIMPLDLASLAGTLGGIAEIAASALGEGRASDAARPARPTRNVVPPSPPPANPT